MYSRTFAFLMMGVMGYSVMAEEQQAESGSSSRPREPPSYYPYAKQQVAGVSFGDNAGLAVPSYVLILGLLAILAVIGWLVYKIFDTQTQKENARLLKKAKKEKKEGEGKGHKSGSTKSEPKKTSGSNKKD